MRRAAALVLLALTLTGCATNAERSARLAKLDHHRATSQTGLHVTHENPDVKILSTAVLHDENGTAAVVTVRNVSGTALRDVPIAITVRSARGSSLYTNSAPGLAPALVSVPLLPAHGELTWIDDQVQTAGAAASVVAQVGEAPAAAAEIPTLTVQGAHLVEESSNSFSAEGKVVNRSGTTQEELVVYAVGRRAGRIVAAGRAVLPQALAGESTQFQVFFIGDPRGARLTFSTPPTTLG